MTKKTLSLTISMLLVAVSGMLKAQQTGNSYAYEVPQTPWQESFGNHRAVLQIDSPSEIAELDFYWRRSDKDVDQRLFLIVNAETGDTIANINRIKVDEQQCSIQFGPIEKKGKYYFYYLPYQVQKRHGAYSGNYLAKEKAPANEWIEKSKKSKKTVKAYIAKIESRTLFDSFYPMEITTTETEKKNYLKQNPSALWLFPEDRKNPIRMLDNIPLKWLQDKQGKTFAGVAAPNEYYAFQIGVWAAEQPVENISYKASTLQCGKTTIPATAITCFNVEGTDPYGKTFTKEVSIAQNAVQPLWFGIDIPEGQTAGIYTGSITISDAKGKKGIVPISIHVTGTPLPDRGDNELWRHSRLRWLNSTLGIDDTPTQPYTAMTMNENSISCLGRTVTVDKVTGLPAQIDAWGTDILGAPIRFIIETQEGIKTLNAVPKLSDITQGHVSGSWEAEDEDLIVNAKILMEFDGWVNYIHTITPKRDVHIKDIRLEIPMKNEVASYFLGAGLPGQDMPQAYEGKWDAPEKTANKFGLSITTDQQQQWLWPFDSFWAGNARAGIHCELRGSNYTGPLLNPYRPPYPKSWNNSGKGGFSVKREEKTTNIVTYSGERILKVGQPVTFDFALIITPVKQIDMKAQFTDRYYHNGSKPVPTDEDVEAGVRIINIHHANEYNPFINYPFLTVDKMKAFTSKWHQKGCKVKLYYTLRELTSATAEVWAIRSLGNEILRQGKGGGFPWCREHLKTGYTPQWYQPFEQIDETGITADAALLTSESNSRWYNYYVEGLRWMVKNLDIDGVYLDDVSFDRHILKRMRRAMESVKPGCIIDLHSNTGFSKGPANQYTDFFPYMDKVWFGESFLYDKMTPTNWLVESSGIPFGLTGDMLFRGGNKWLGMQYGMTVRHPWLTEGVICDPRIIWKIWDDFGIANATMLGFWEQNPAVTASDKDIKVTAYRKPGQVLLSIGNYSDYPKTVRLNIDWEQLGLDPQKVKLTAPGINDFQEAETWKVNDEITVQPRKGWLIYVE